MNIRYFLVRTPALSLIFSLVFGMAAPVTVLASSHTTNLKDASGSIDQSSLSVESRHRVRLAGTASSTTRVRYEITATSSSKTLAKSHTIHVKRDGSWSGSVSKKLKDGTYDVTLYAISGSKKAEIASSTLYVGVRPALLSVSSVPLLFGSTAAHGQTVPVSYLQVRNVSSSTVAIKGFWVAQNGTAPDASVIGFSSVNDLGTNRTFAGGTERSGVLKNGKGFVPSTEVLAPGERRLFTLKAQLSASSGSYAGSTLSLDVTGIDAQSELVGSFPIKGTTWRLAR
jgi:hypothetical protein